MQPKVIWFESSGAKFTPGVFMKGVIIRNTN